VVLQGTHTLLCTDIDRRPVTAYLGWWGDEVADPLGGWGLVEELVVSRRPVIGGDLLAIGFDLPAAAGGEPAGWQLSGLPWLFQVGADLLLIGLGAPLLALSWRGQRRPAQARPIAGR
jgi:hypothetical protein